MSGPMLAATFTQFADYEWPAQRVVLKLLLAALRLGKIYRRDYLR
ncbi:MAG: hypothetical protein ACI9WS_001153 [Paraglaciecola psychrophila]|jgi:hypothetical protein